MTQSIQRLISELVPFYRGDAVAQQFDRQTRVLDRRALRAELPRVLGARWNKRSYDMAAMEALAKDTRLSESARRGAAFLSSPDGSAALARMNARSGKAGDASFGISDLESENSAALKERTEVHRKKHEIAATRLEQTTKALVDNFNQAVVASVRRSSLNPPSTRID